MRSQNRCFDRGQHVHGTRESVKSGVGSVAQLLGLGTEDQGSERRVSLSGGTVERKTLCRSLARKPARRYFRCPKNEAATESSVIRKTTDGTVYIIHYERNPKSGAAMISTP